MQQPRAGEVLPIEMVGWVVALALAIGAAGAGATRWGASIRWTGAAAAAWLALAIVMAMRRRWARARLRRHEAVTFALMASEQRVLALRDDLAGWSLMVCLAAGVALAPWPVPALTWIVRVVCGVMALQGTRVLLRTAVVAWRNERPMACLRVASDARSADATIAITGLVLSEQVQAVLTLLSFARDQNQEGSPFARTLATLPVHLAERSADGLTLRCAPLPARIGELVTQTAGGWWFGKLGMPDYLLVRLDIQDAGQSWRFEWR